MSATGKQQKRPAMCHRVSTQVIMNTDLLSVWNHMPQRISYESIIRVLSELSISGNSGPKYHENVNVPHGVGICVTLFSIFLSLQ